MSLHTGGRISISVIISITYIRKKGSYMSKHLTQRAKTDSSVFSIAPLVLTGITTVIGLVLSSSIVSATNDNVVDQVNITVPVSCTMTGTGMDSHSTEIENGLYENNIGTTTLHAFCNDNEGFAIYAAGYTGNEIGGTNSNKLVGTNASSNATIVSGIATTAGNPDISNWAMKLAISQDSGDTTSTNAFTIDSAPNVDLPSEAEQSATQASFSSYHVVPNEYVKVAHKNSMTDMAASTGGVKLTTTYAAYISKTQPADTYAGQVIYTLVHPANGNPPVAPGKVGVNYHANGSTFADNTTENQVIYASSPMYIATTPLISKTENIDNQGNQNGSYPATTGDPVPVPVTATGAEKMKVVIRYGLSENTGLCVIEGNYDGQGTPEKYEYISDAMSVAAGTSTYIFDGDAVTFYMDVDYAPETTDGHDYGYFAEVYPIYATEQTDTEPTSEIVNFVADKGTFAQTTDWNAASAWYTEYNGTNKSFDSEFEVRQFISEHSDALSGTMIDVYKNTYAQMLSDDYSLNNRLWQAVPDADTWEEQNESVKAIRMASALPSGFTPTTDNTLSDENSVYPIYVWHEFVDGVGTLLIYSPADKIRLGSLASHLFDDFEYLVDISGVAEWDTGSVMSMRRMFRNDTSLTDLSPLAKWDTGSVMRMDSMFYGATSLTDLSSLASWDTGNVQYMSDMFSGCTSLTSLSGLSDWDTGNVQRMNGMFSECTSLTDASAINDWEIGNVESFNGMFYETPSHPNFTKRSGTWDEGTFVPSA